MSNIAERFETDSAIDLESETDSEMPDLISDSESDYDYESEVDEDYNLILNQLDNVLENIEVLRKQTNENNMLLQNTYKTHYIYISTERYFNIMLYLYFLFFYFLN